METDETIEPLNPEQVQALAALVRAGAAFVNSSPINTELVGTDFHAALNRGEATITIEIVLPRGGLQYFADWPAHGIERQPLGKMEFPSAIVPRWHS